MDGIPGGERKPTKEVVRLGGFSDQSERNRWIRVLGLQFSHLSALVSRLFLRTFSLDLSSDRRSAAFLLRSVSTSALAGRIPLDSFISHTQTSTLNYATRPRPFPRRALRMVSSDKTSLLVCQSGPTLRGEPAEVEI